MTLQTVDTDTLIVLKEEEGIRIDKLLSDRFQDKSRTYFQYLIENDSVLLNGSPIKKCTPVKEGDEIEVCFILTPEISLEPQNIPLQILYEDEDLLCVNKQAGMVVHPAPGHYSSTFVNALLFHCKNLANIGQSNLRPGIVHRLDKDTSGLLLAAKTALSHQNLISLFCQRQIMKNYLCICIGKPNNQTISAPIRRHPIKRKEMVVHPEGKEAITHIQVLAFNEKYSLLLAYPVTGRTHQIRVHLKHIGCPILGDFVYGNTKVNDSLLVPRQMLHSYRMKFSHPTQNTPLELIAPLPEDIKKFLRILFQKDPDTI